MTWGSGEIPTVFWFNQQTILAIDFMSIPSSCYQGTHLVKPFLVLNPGTVATTQRPGFQVRLMYPVATSRPVLPQCT